MEPWPKGKAPDWRSGGVSWPLQVRVLLVPLRDVVKRSRRRCAMPKARVRVPPSRSLSVPYSSTAERHPVKVGMQVRVLLGQWTSRSAGWSVWNHGRVVRRPTANRVGCLRPCRFESCWFRVGRGGETIGGGPDGQVAACKAAQGGSTPPPPSFGCGDRDPVGR